jgi:hypothetical protein
VRRSLTFSALWVAAAAVATTAAWQGVGLVTNQVTDQRPAALSAADVEASLEATAATGATPTPGGSATAPTSPSSPTTTTTAPAATGETRTYTVEGGSAALRFTPDRVEVVWSTPNPGYSVDTEAEHVNGVRVEFESDTHRSRIEGWWDGGPQERVREQPR